MTAVKKPKINDANRVKWAIKAEDVKSILNPYYDNSGKLKGSFWAYFDTKELLVSLIDFPDSVSDYDKRVIASRCCKNNFSGNIKKLLDSVQNEVLSLASSKRKKYIALCGITIPHAVSLPTRKIDGMTISFGLSVRNPANKKFASEAGRLYEMAGVEIPHALSQKVMKIFVEAGSEAEAFDKAEHSSKLLRSMWTLIGTYRSMSHHIGKSQPSLGPLGIGPAYSLHKKNGQLACELIAKEPDYNTYRLLKIQQKDWDYILKTEVKLRRKLNKLVYADELKKALITYGDALDLKNYNFAILHLWGILEKLSGKGPRESHVLTVNRVASIHGSKDSVALEKIILDRCRIYRNKLAHSARSDERAWWVVGRLKLCVDSMLAFHLHHGHLFDSLEGAGTFLDLLHGHADSAGVAEFMKKAKRVNPLI